MKRNIAMIVTAFAMVISGMAFAAPAANAADERPASDTHVSKKAKPKSKNKSNMKCDKAPGSFVAPNGLTVLNLNTCFDVKILKKMGCDTEAGKIERPAPPRDPKSRCKGKASVKFKIKYETPDCPTGWIGGKVRLKLEITQKLSALGLSKSIATGRVDTWARTKIKLLDKFKGEVTNNCVLIPVPPPTPEPTFSCDMLAVNKGVGRSAIIGAFSTSQSNGATFKHAVIEWGDGSSDTFGSPVGKSHTYGADGPYTIKATAVFVVNGQEKSTTSSGCQAAVKFDTPPPPVEEPPVFVQFREMNDLEVNWVDDHCVTVDTPAGHTATVYWEAQFGSFATPSKTAQDGVQICSDYKAPSEVPAGGTDTITVRAVDNVTDLSVTKETEPFRIDPAVGHPG